MPCTLIDIPGPPNFPDAIDLVPKLPKPSIAIPNPCCLLPVPASLKFSVPLPPGTVNTGLGEAVKTAFKATKTWLASLSPKCPWQ